MPHFTTRPLPNALPKALPQAPSRIADWRFAGALCAALAGAAVLGLCGPARAAKAVAPAALPAVNLVVEVRVIDEARASGHGDYTVSTLAAPRQAVETLQLLLANGQAGAVRLSGALPVQWLQGAARGGAPAASGGSAPTDRAGAVAYAVTWVPSGQSLSVRPQWPGGDSPVTLELNFSSTMLQTAPGTPLPATRTQQAGSTLRLALGVWTAFAATGVPQEEGEPGRVSTLTLAARGRQLMQVRVSLP
jgi:hypothetical protein